MTDDRAHVPDTDGIKKRQQATWSAGDYGKIGITLQIVGETLCEAVDLRSGAKVLDVAAGNGNVFYVASDTETLRLFHEPDYDRIHPVARAQVRMAFSSRMHTNPDHGMVLTDDHNPVEFHDAANREEIRRRLAEGMRR